MADDRVDIELAIEVGRVVATAALRSEPRLRAREAAEGLIRLTGADTAMLVLLERSASGVVSIVDGLEAGEWPDGARESYLAYMKDDHGGDPFYAAVISRAGALDGLKGGPMAFHRAQLVEDAAWYGSVHYRKYRGAVGFDGCVYALMHGDGPGRLWGIGLHRRIERGQFGDRDAAVARVGAGAMRPLIADLARSGVRAMSLLQPLTPRHRSILVHLADGRAPKDVATALGLTVGSVRTYVKQIYQRLGVRTRGELAALCAREGLVSALRERSGENGRSG